jgi:hypothetical protein
VVLVRGDDLKHKNEEIQVIFRKSLQTFEDLYVPSRVTDASLSTMLSARSNYPQWYHHSEVLSQPTSAQVDSCHCHCTKQSYLYDPKQSLHAPAQARSCPVSDTRLIVHTAHRGTLFPFVHTSSVGTLYETPLGMPWVRISREQGSGWFYAARKRAVLPRALVRSRWRTAQSWDTHARLTARRTMHALLDSSRRVVF